MAITNVADTDTFDQWRVKTNTIASDLGDIATLTTAATNAAAAVVELNAEIGNPALLEIPGADLVAVINEARRLAFAITLALG